MNTFNVLTFIQVRTDNNKFMQGKKMVKCKNIFLQVISVNFLFF